MKTGLALAFMFLIISHPVHSETALYLGGISDHPFSIKEYTSTHDLVGVEHNGWLVARFRNSHSRESYAVGHGWSKSWGDVKATLFAGAIRGYTKCWGHDDSNTNICPMITPIFTYEKYTIQPAIIILGPAVALAVRFEL